MDKFTDSNKHNNNNNNNNNSYLLMLLSYRIFCFNMIFWYTLQHAAGRHKGASLPGRRQVARR